MNKNDHGESLVTQFINAQNEDKKRVKQNEETFNGPEMAQKKLAQNLQDGKSICLDTMLGKIYKDALPFEDPDKNCSLDTAAGIMHDYIDKRTGGKGSEWYVREAIKRNNSPTLKAMIAEAEKLVKEYGQSDKAREIREYVIKKQDAGKINVADLDFHIDDKENVMDKLSKKMELDEVSGIIQKNVEETLQKERERAQKEEEYNKKLEEILAQDDSVQDQESMEAALEKLNPIKEPTIYQPSLFEAILTKNIALTESEEYASINPMTEAIHEYTKLNITRALRLEKFTNDDVKRMANEYLK